MFRKLKTQITDTVSEKLKQAQDTITQKQSSTPQTRSRVNSFSSVASDTNSTVFTNYSSPQKQYYPPSDIESDAELSFRHDNDTLNTVEPRKLQHLVDQYKNKFVQLKKAYLEIENEKEKIKNILTQNQDKALRRIQDLKDQIELDKRDKIEAEVNFKRLLDEKDKIISTLKSGHDVESNDQNSENNDNDDGSNDKMNQIKLLLVNYKKIMKTQSDQIKQLTEENENLKNKPLQQDTNNGDEMRVLQEKIIKSEKRLNDSISELREKDTFYQEQIKSFQDEFMTEKAKWRDDVDVLNKRNQELNMTITETETFFKSLTEKYTMDLENDVKHACNKLGTILSNYENDKLELNKKIKNYELLLEEKTSELDNFKNNDVKSEYEKQLNEKNGIIESLERELNEIKNVFRTAQEVNDVEIKKIREEYEKRMRVVKEDFETRIESLNNDLSSVRGNNESVLRSTQEANDVRVNELRQEFENRLNVEKGDRERQMEDKVNEIKSLEEVLDKLKSELKMTQNEFEDKKQEYERNLCDKLNIVNNLENELNECRNVLKSVQDENEIRINELRKEYDSKQYVNHKDLEEQLNEKSIMIENFERELNDIKSNLKSVQSEFEVKINEMKQEYEVKQLEKSELIEKLERELSDVKNSNQVTLKSIRDECEVRINQIKHDYEDKQHAMQSDFEAQLREKVGAIEKLESELNVLKSTQENTELKVAELKQDYENRLINNETQLNEMIENLKSELTNVKSINESIVKSTEIKINEIRQEYESKLNNDTNVESVNVLQSSCVVDDDGLNELKNENDYYKSLFSTIETSFELEKSDDLSLEQRKINFLKKLETLKANLNELEISNKQLLTNIQEENVKYTKIENDLKAELEVLTQDVISKSNEIKCLSSENSQLKENLISKSKFEESYNELLLKSQEETKSHVEKYLLLEEEHKLAKSKIISIETNCSKQIEEINQTLDKLKVIENNLLNSEKKNCELSSAQNVLNEKINVLENELVEKNSMIQKLNGDLVELNNQLNSNIESLNGKLETSKNELQKFVEKVNKELEVNKMLSESNDVLKCDNQFYLNILNLLESRFEMRQVLKEKNEKLLKENIELFDTESNKINTENQALKKECENFKLELSNLQNELASKLKTIEDLNKNSAKIGELKTKMENLRYYETRFFELEEQKKNLSNELNQKSDEISKLQTVNGNLVSQCELFKSENSNMKNELVLKVKNIEDLSQKIDKNNVEIGELKKNIESLKKFQVMCAELEDQKKSLTNELNQKRMENTKIIESNSEKLKQADENQVNVQNENAKLLHELNDITNKYKNLNEQYSETCNKIDLYEANKQKLSKILNLCKNDNSSLLNVIKSLQDEMQNSKDTDMTRLSQTINNLDNEYELLSNKVTENERVIQSLHEKISSQDDEINNLKQSAYDDELKYKKILNNNQSLKNEVQKFNELYRKANEKATNYQSQISNKSETDEFYNKAKVASQTAKKGSVNLYGATDATILQMYENGKVNSNFMSLESTEVDYLRQIVYAYMMGTDPVTMAKVIVAVLKFSDDETKKVIEHVKSKQFTWFSPTK